MFNRTQWLIVATLFFLGVIVHVAVNSTEPSSGHIAGAVGAMIPVMIVTLVGGAIGRRRSQQAATPGIIIGYIAVLLLANSQYWA